LYLCVSQKQLSGCFFVACASETKRRKFAAGIAQERSDKGSAPFLGGKKVVDNRKFVLFLPKKNSFLQKTVDFV